MLNGTGHYHIAHFQYHRRIVRKVGTRRIHFSDLTPHHQPRQLLFAASGHGAAIHQVAVAQYRHAVGDLLDFTQLVGDIQNGHAPLAQAVDQCKQHLYLVFGQGSGGFVHDQHAHIAGNRLGDFHHLLIGGTEIFHAGAWIDMRFKLCQRRPATFAHGSSVQKDPPAQFATQEDVLLHAELFRQCQFLVDHYHTVGFRLTAGAVMPLAAVHQHLARSRAKVACQNFDQCRFSRAVLAQQGMHFTCLQIEINVEQHLVIAKGAAEFAR